MRDLVGKNLFSGAINWQDGILYSKQASQMKADHKCPNCGGILELAGKDVIKCPFCGAEVFLLEDKEVIPMDPIEKAKAQMGPLTSKLTGLPGISGYREKEMRRDSDKLVRERLVHELETAPDAHQRAAGAGSAAAGGLLLMDDMEQRHRPAAAADRSHPHRGLWLRGLLRPAACAGA